jgi:tyrocidine synthetase-3
MEAFGRDIDCIINELIIPFDLSKSPLLRVNYIKDINNEKFLMIDMHHIISDGISLQILIKEAISLYKGNELKELSIQYKDFSVWQYNYQTKEYINNLKSYWEQKIKDLNYTQLPHKYVDIGRKAGGINKIIIFNNDEILKIDEFCKGSNVTKFTFFIAVLGIILMNELTQDDIGIGIPSIGRNHSQLQDIIGLFLNVVLIRINIDKNDTFETYLRKVNEILVEALEYQELPYDELYNMAVEKFGIKTDSLFTIMFNYMPYMAGESDDGSIKLNETTLDLYNNKYISPKYDLSFYVNENKDNLVINMVYKDTIEEYIIDRIANAFSSISSMIIGDASMQLKNISYNETFYEDSFSNNYNNLFDNEDFFD